MSDAPSWRDWTCLSCGRQYAEYVTTCLGCFADHRLVKLGRRAQALVDYEPELTDARELARDTWSSVTSAAYPELVLGHRALVVLSGAEGSGKSTMAARLLDTIAAPVLLVSWEEPPGPSLGMRLARAGVKREGFHILGRATIDQVAATAKARRVRAICIDSVQSASLTARDLRHLLLVLPGLDLLAVISQLNTRGTLSGPRSLPHEADVHIALAAGVWTLVKSRYQPTDPPVSGIVLRALREEINDEPDSGSNTECGRGPLHLLPA